MSKIFQTIKDLSGLFLDLIHYVLWNVWKMKGSLFILAIGFVYTLMAGYAQASGQDKSGDMFWSALVLIFLGASCSFADGRGTKDAATKFWSDKWDRRKARMTMALKKEFGEDRYYEVFGKDGGEWDIGE